MHDPSYLFTLKVRPLIGMRPIVIHAFEARTQLVHCRRTRNAA